MGRLEPQRGCLVVDLELIRPEDLHTVWDVVREGMLKSSEYSNDQWIPEDAYCAIKANQASLYLWVFEGMLLDTSSFRKSLLITGHAFISGHCMLSMSMET